MTYELRSVCWWQLLHWSFKFAEKYPAQLSRNMKMDIWSIWINWFEFNVVVLRLAISDPIICSCSKWVGLLWLQRLCCLTPTPNSWHAIVDVDMITNQKELATRRKPDHMTKEVPEKIAVTSTKIGHSNGLYIWKLFFEDVSCQLQQFVLLGN